MFELPYLTIIRHPFRSHLSRMFTSEELGGLTDAHLPQVQRLTAATAGLRLLRRAAGCRVGAVQDQEELGQSA